MGRLTRLANKFGTDKGDIKHKYTDVYETFLHPFRNKIINILEIGVDKGASARMWLEYFPHATVYGIDIENKHGITNNRFKFFQGSQVDVDLISYVIKQANIFHFIIDDGSHMKGHQDATIKRLFPHLCKGGIYIIEDLDCKRSIPYADTLKKLKEYIDDGKEWMQFESKHIRRNTESIKIWKDKCAIFTKKGRLYMPTFGKNMLDEEVEYMKYEFGTYDIEEYMKDITLKVMDTPEHKRQIHFTTTATARIDIVERTFKSFYNNLKDVDFKKCTLWINIDPAPKGINRLPIIDMAKKYFGTVQANLPTEPNYTAAYDWVWTRASSDIILNLEDDWKLIEEVSINDLLKQFENTPTLYEVVFNRYNREELRRWGYKYPSVPTSPALMHARYYKEIAGKLDYNINPESQVQHNTDKEFKILLPFRNFPVNPKHYVSCFPEDLSKVICVDIGREWIDKTRFKNPANSNLKKVNFTSWTN